MQKRPLSESPLAREPEPVEVQAGGIAFMVDATQRNLGRVFAVRAAMEQGYLTMEDLDFVLDWDIEEPFHLRYLDGDTLLALLTAWYEAVSGVDTPLDTAPNSGPGQRDKAATQTSRS